MRSVQAWVHPTNVKDSSYKALDNCSCDIAGSVALKVLDIYQAYRKACLQGLTQQEVVYERSC